MAQPTSSPPGPGAPPDPAAERRAKNRNLALRVATAGVLIPVVIPLMWLGGVPMATVVGLACALCATEICSMAMPGDALRWPAAAAAFAMPFFFVLPGLGGDRLHWLWAALALVVLAMRLLRDAPVADAGPKAAFAVLAGVYGSMAGYLMPLRSLGPGASWQGAGWVLVACAVTWLNDTGAYFAGRFLGRRKLFPRISPAKTWEGFAGGMAASIAGALLFGQLLPHVAVQHLVVAGVLGGICGPLGDLSESMLKRSFGVKDSGAILPGHGGMLDRVDALLFNAPVVYAYAALVVLPGTHA